MVIDNDFYMRLALNEAWKYQGLTYPNPAVGCCIVGKNGEILAIEAHKRAGEAHAEVEALKSAYYKLTNDEQILNISSSSDIHVYLLDNHNGCFRGSLVYTTLEPCSHVGKTPSCASLLSKLKIKKLFIGSLDSNQIASGGTAVLENAGIDVQTQVLEKECNELLAPFNMWNKKRFVFFKWAQRLNGTIDAGTISSEKSRTFVHAMRDVCDLLIIGGNSVRVDRPTLDARMVNGKAPDILIISKSKDFDKTIPLFNVKDREVIISDNFLICENYKNIMIEGGSIMFNLTKNIVDYYLCFISAQVGGTHNFSGEDYKFDILNLQKDDKDIIMWMKQENNRGSK